VRGDNLIDPVVGKSLEQVLRRRALENGRRTVPRPLGERIPLTDRHEIAQIKGTHQGRNTQKHQNPTLQERKMKCQIPSRDGLNFASLR